MRPPFLNWHLPTTPTWKRALGYHFHPVSWTLGLIGFILPHLLFGFHLLPTVFVLAMTAGVYIGGWLAKRRDPFIAYSLMHILPQVGHLYGAGAVILALSQSESSLATHASTLLFFLFALGFITFLAQGQLYPKKRAITIEYLLEWAQHQAILNAKNGVLLPIILDIELALDRRVNSGSMGTYQSNSYSTQTLWHPFPGPLRLTERPDPNTPRTDLGDYILWAPPTTAHNRLTFQRLVHNTHEPTTKNTKTINAVPVANA